MPQRSMAKSPGTSPTANLARGRRWRMLLSLTRRLPMFIRNAWYIAAWSDEVKDKPLARRLGNEPVVLCRARHGRAAALVDRCCHRSAPLSHGEVVAQGLQCGYHGLVFDSTGRCVAIP